MKCSMEACASARSRYSWRCTSSYLSVFMNDSQNAHAVQPCRQVSSAPLPDASPALYSIPVLQLPAAGISNELFQTEREEDCQMAKTPNDGTNPPDTHQPPNPLAVL